LEFLRIAFDQHASPIIIGDEVPGIAEKLAVPGAELDAELLPVSAEGEYLGEDPVLTDLRCDVGSVIEKLGTVAFHPVDRTVMYLRHFATSGATACR
jgi:hypothetical protein